MKMHADRERPRVATAVDKQKRNPSNAVIRLEPKLAIAEKIGSETLLKKTFVAM